MVRRIKEARLIYNPTSGQEIYQENIMEVLDVLEDVGYELALIKLRTISAQNEAEEPLRQALI